MPPLQKYTEDPHIDGFISQENYEHYLKPSASLITSKKEEDVLYYLQIIQTLEALGMEPIGCS